MSIDCVEVYNTHTHSNLNSLLLSQKEMKNIMNLYTSLLCRYAVMLRVLLIIIASLETKGSKLRKFMTAPMAN